MMRTFMMRPHFKSGSSNSLYGRPSGRDSSIYRIFRYIELFCPLNNALFYAIYFYKYVVSSVPSLLFSCYPSTVFLTVRTVIVNAFQGKSFFVGIKHVVSKVFETKPTFTNSYSPTTVSWKIFCVAVKTSSLHIIPPIVKTMSSYPSSQTMFFIHIYKTLIKLYNKAQDALRVSCASFAKLTNKPLIVYTILT